MTTAKIRLLIRDTPYSLLLWGGRCCFTISRLSSSGIRGRLLGRSGIGGGLRSWFPISFGFLGTAIRGRLAIRCGLLTSIFLLLAALLLLRSALLLIFAALLLLLAALLLLLRSALLLLLWSALLLLLRLLAGGEGNVLGGRLALLCFCLGYLGFSLCSGSFSLRLFLFGDGFGDLLFLDYCLSLRLLSLLLLGFGVLLRGLGLLNGVLLVFLGFSHLLLFLFLGFLRLLLLHGLFLDVSGLFVGDEPVEGVILGGNFSLHFLLCLLYLRLMLAQLYLSFIVFELSFGLRLFAHFELVVGFVR